MPDDAFGQHLRAYSVRLRRHVSRMHRAGLIYGTFLIAALMLANRGAAEAPAKKNEKPATTQAAKLSPSAITVRQFHDALKAGKASDALKFIGASPSPIRDAEKRVKRLATTLSGGEWDFEILDSKASGEIAVVMINDYLKSGRKTIDIKPWYLIRQQGEWKLLGKFTDFELKEYGFDADRVAAYRGLEKWANEREPQLRKEQPDCGC
jgi:hypothetical protein